MNYTKRIFLLPVLVLFIYFFKGCNQESIELLTTENLELNRKIDSLLTITDNLNRQINSVENQIQDVYSSQSQTQDGINELTDELQDLLDSTNSNDQSIDNLTQSLNDLLGQNQNLSSQLDSLNTQVDSLDDTIIGNNEFADLTQLVESLQNQINQLSTQLSDLSDDVDDLIGHTHDSSDTSNENSNDTNDNTLKFREKYQNNYYGGKLLLSGSNSQIYEWFSFSPDYSYKTHGNNNTDGSPPSTENEYCMLYELGGFDNNTYYSVMELVFEAQDSMRIKHYTDDDQDGFNSNQGDEGLDFTFVITNSDTLNIRVRGVGNDENIFEDFVYTKQNFVPNTNINCSLNTYDW